MLKSYKYRIYPTKDQSIMIDKTIGVCRFVYNLALETKLYAYRSHGKTLSAFELCHQLVDLKKECPWVGEVCSQAIQTSVINMDTAFKNFFRGRGYPKFRSKRNGGSFHCQHDRRRVDWDNSTLSIPKIKDIPIEISKRFDGRIKNVTISKTPTNKYFASILVETTQEKLITNKVAYDTTIGIDVGIKSFVVTSNGRYFEPNRRLKANLDRLKHLSRNVSRKKKGGNNRKKAVKRLAALHEKITNQRNDYCHKVTTELIRDNQTDTYVIEDLSVSNMIKNRKLSQALSDVSFGEFFRQMKYKCDWYGKNLITVGRFDPTTKTCSDCGTINNDLTLKDREWTCAVCGSNHERDFNAAKNIRNSGLKKHSGRGTSGEPIEQRTIVRAKK